MPGHNFHTEYSNTPGSETLFTVASMGAPLIQLDKAITKLKNIVIGCAGVITYNKTTGVLSWSATLTIHFNSDAGLSITNTVAAGSVTLTDGQFAYVDLSETNAAALTVTAATYPSAAASNFIAYNRIILAYRDTTSDNIYSGYLNLPLNDPDKLVQTLTDADAVTIDWSKGSTAEITLDRATTAFTFSGAYNGQRCVLIIKQYAGPGAVTFGAEVRAGTDLASPPTLTATTDKKDYLGYIYNGSDTKYDFVSLTQGF
ncbi:MAG: hypothetical protein WC637_00570 [Victivallales bacterium]|jgi:hypothetical protein